jgi:hypothetical protein
MVLLTTSIAAVASLIICGLILVTLINTSREYSDNRQFPDARWSS